MKRSRAVLSVLVTTLVLVSTFGLAQEADEQVLEAVRSFAEQYDKAFNQQDAEAFGQLFTEDAMFLAFNSPTHEGREAIVESFGFAPENVGTFEHSIEVTEAMSLGDMIHGLGTFELVGAEGVFQEGKFMALYKQQDDGLQIHRIITNSSLPLPESTDE